MGKEGFGGCMRRGERTMRVSNRGREGEGLFRSRFATPTGRVSKILGLPAIQEFASTNKEIADNAARPQRKFQQQCQRSYAIIGIFRR